MMKMKNLGLVGVVLLGLAFTACSKEEDNGGVNETPRSVVIDKLRRFRPGYRR